MFYMSNVRGTCRVPSWHRRIIHILEFVLKVDATTISKLGRAPHGAQQLLPIP
jgi:hypothetical protein